LGVTRNLAFAISQHNAARGKYGVANVGLDGGPGPMVMEGHDGADDWSIRSGWYVKLEALGSWEVTGGSRRSGITACMRARFLGYVQSEKREDTGTYGLKRAECRSEMRTRGLLHQMVNQATPGSNQNFGAQHQPLSHVLPGVGGWGGCAQPEAPQRRVVPCSRRESMCGSCY